MLSRRDSRLALATVLTSGSVLAGADRVLAGIGGPPLLLRFLVSDRTSDTIWLLEDANHNGVIDEPDEVSVFFSAANAAGTPAILNVSSLAARNDGYVLMGDGDSTARRWLWARDCNNDDDAMDVGESGLYIDLTNAGASVTSFPTGSAFDAAGVPYLVNAGNASGPDAIFRSPDNNSDRDAQDSGESADYLTTGLFGVGNGPYSPQEIAFGSDAALYLRNSSSGLQGVWRIVDGNSNFNANDPGEAAAWFDATNASSVVPSAGLSLERNRVLSNSLYTVMLATGGIDQVFRLTDANADFDANDAGEAVKVIDVPDSGVTFNDLLSSPDGSVYVSDTSGKRLFRFFDTDADDLFLAPAERATFFANSSLILSDARWMAYLTHPADIDANWRIEVADIFAFLNVWFTQFGSVGVNLRADTDCNGLVEVADIFTFLNRWFAGFGT